MKVLIYSPVVLWYYFFATELELSLLHMEKGDEVHYLGCEASLAFCEINRNHNLYNCSACIQMRYRGLELINLPIKNRHELNLENFIQNIKFDPFKSIEELKNFNIDNVDFGSMVLSSLITYLREAKPDVKKYHNMIQKMLNSSIAVYYSVLFYIEKIKPDILYIYNGRFSSVRSALRAGINSGVSVITYEHGGNINNYCLADNIYMFDLEYLKKDLLFHINKNTSCEFMKEKAYDWYIRKRNNNPNTWFSVTLDQKENKLPDNFDKTKRNITIFNSSDEEFESVDDNWKKSPFIDQNKTIALLVNSQKDNNNIHFYLRIHPILKGINNSQIQEINNLNFKNLTVISAESDISTYELMNSSEKIITFGSTTGIEAAYWGKPSILMGRAIYEDLGSCYKPKNIEEAIGLIPKKIEPLEIEGAVKYGYWEETKGFPFKYYKPEMTRDNLIIGSFKEKYLTHYIKNTTENFKILDNFTRFNILNDNNINTTFVEKKPLVSIIIDSFNNKNELIKTINGIFNQAYKNWEIFIIYDEFGPDNAVINLQTHLGFTDRCNFIYLEENDFSKIRKIGMEKSNGEYIIFIKSGDIFLKYSIEALVRNLLFSDGDVKLVQGYIVKWDLEKGYCSYDSDYIEEDLTPDFQTILIEKEILRNLEIFYTNENIMDTFIVILNKYKIKKVNVPVFINYFRLNTNKYLKKIL